MEEALSCPAREAALGRRSLGDASSLGALLCRFVDCSRGIDSDARDKDASGEMCSSRPSDCWIVGGFPRLYGAVKQQVRPVCRQNTQGHFPEQRFFLLDTTGQ